MQVTDIVNLVIEKVAKKYNIKEDDVSWHKIAIELAYMYKEIKFSNIEIPDPFQTSMLDQIEEKEERSAEKEKVYSKEVLNCYRILLDYFPEHLRPKTDKHIKNWYEVIDKLNRIDGVPFSEIERITKLAREDSFWSKNFLSLTKLRMKNKEKIPYIVVFSEKFKQKEQTINRQTKEVINKNLQGW